MERKEETELEELLKSEGALTVAQGREYYLVSYPTTVNKGLPDERKGVSYSLFKEGRQCRCFLGIDLGPAVKEIATAYYDGIMHALREKES